MVNPTPVDISKLGAILNRSKAVMEVTEAKTTNNKHKHTINEDYGYGDEEKEMNFEEIDFSKFSTPTSEVKDYTDEQVMASNMPQAVKEAMLKNKIPKLSSPPPKFTANDLAESMGIVVENSKPIKQISKEQNSGGVDVNLLEALVKKIVKESLDDYFKEAFVKKVREEAIKDTMNLLIKEGKITIKKKV